jgi:hypothetical protein
MRGSPDAGLWLIYTEAFNVGLMAFPTIPEGYDGAPVMDYSC